MTPGQKLFVVVSLVAGLIFCVTALLVPRPPLPATLFAKQEITVTAASVEKRSSSPSALPVIDVRDASGEVSLLQGYQWMDESNAEVIVARYSVGEMIRAPRWNDQFWRGLSGFVDWLLLIFSLLSAFTVLFGMLMVWKLRQR